MNNEPQRALDRPAPPRTRPVSERPFPIDLPGLGEFRERAPLVHVFQHALMRWIDRHFLAHHLARRVPKVLTRGRMAFARPHSAECGVFQGHSLKACAQIAEKMHVPVTFFGFDTFEGLPKLSPTDHELAPQKSPYLKRTLFTNTSVQRVRDLVAPHMLLTDMRLFQGLFSETLPQAPSRRYFFVNVDCDLYQGHHEVLSYFYSKTEPGGIIYFDDYSSQEYPMARQAIDEFLADKPEVLWYLRFGEDGANLTKAFIIKQ